MEKATLKSIIIGLKLSGLSFADISTRLKEDYDIEMSRQAVCGMYNRAMSKNKLDDSVAMAIMTTDVCRFYSLGKSIYEIKDIISNSKYELTINQIKLIIRNNKEVVDEMINEYINTAVNNITDFDKLIAFNGVVPSDKVIYYIKEKAVEKIFVSNSKELLNSLLNNGVDKTIIKDTAKRFNIAKNISEIMQ